MYSMNISSLKSDGLQYSHMTLTENYHGVSAARVILSKLFTASERVGNPRIISLSSGFRFYSNRQQLASYKKVLCPSTIYIQA